MVLANKACSLALLERQGALGRALKSEALLEVEVEVGQEKAHALSMARLVAAKVPLLEGKLEASQEAGFSFRFV